MFLQDFKILISIVPKPQNTNFHIFFDWKQEDLLINKHLTCKWIKMNPEMGYTIASYYEKNCSKTARWRVM